jgi:hypothetical protein
MQKRIAMLGLIVAGLVAGSVRADVVLGPGGFAYTYDAGSGVSDPNAVLSGTSYISETVVNGNAAYYHTTNANSDGTVSYTFTAAPGFFFSGDANEKQTDLVAFNPGGSITTEVSVDGGGFTFLDEDGPAPDNNFQFVNSSVQFNVDGAATFTLRFTLHNPSGNAIFTQVFRETNGATDAPFKVSGLVAEEVPEPASLGLAMVGGLAAVTRRRGR